MFRKVIFYILMILITLQSIAAFADFQLYIQSDADHIYANNHHHYHYDTSTQLPATVEINSTHYDCNHHCQCHGSTIFFSSKAPSNIYCSNGNCGSFDYQFSLISFQDSPDNPPPIP